MTTTRERHEQSTVPVLDAARAVASARRLAERYAAGAATRDHDRALPAREIADLAASGLLSITVPAMHGGPELPVAAVVEVFRLLGWGDPNIAQIPHSHFVFLNQLRLRGTHDQQALLFGEVLAGKVVANAQSEFGTKHVRDFRTTLTACGPSGASGSGRWLLNGEKFYCTGSLFADYLAVLCHRGPDGPLAVAWIPADAPGVELVDDWDALGQRTTGSGTVKLHDVVVTEEWVTGFSETFDGPTTYGAFAQVMHAAIDAGIARRALDEAAEFVRTASRPYPDAINTYGVERAAEDPLTVQAFGEMELACRGAEALLAEAARAIDRANANLTAASAVDASLAAAASRASTTKVSVEVTSRLFEVAGTRAAVGKLALDRHWRNARTHTLHDPAAWKVHHLGRWAVDATAPPRHGQL